MWITSPTSKFINREETLFRKQKFFLKLQIVSKIKKVEKLLKTFVDKDLRSFEQEVLAPNKFNTLRKYPRSMRRATRMTSIKKLDKKLLKTDKDTWDAFHHFFCNVFTKTKQIPGCSHLEKTKNNRNEPNKYLEKSMNEQDIKKTTGPDSFGLLAYKNLAKALSKSVLLKFQTLVNKRIVPEDWKLSEVFPIFNQR